MMAKRLLFTAMFPLLLLAVSECRKAERKPEIVRIRIVCTFLPIYVIAQNVVNGVPGVLLQNLLPSNVGCPHNYALTPADAVTLEDADVLIMNGMGMERFLQDSPFLRREGLQVINASQTVQPLLIAAGAESQSRHHSAAGQREQSRTSSENQLNPHAWVSPFAAALMTENIGKRLAEIDPEYAEIYLRNAENYSSRLRSLGQNFVNLIAKASNRRIVTFHASFDYLARDLGLQIVASIESVPGVEPSAKELALLIEKIKSTQPAAIFSEPQYSAKLAQMIARETGVPVFTLDPAVSGASGPESYITVMQRNLQVLSRALALNSQE